MLNGLAYGPQITPTSRTANMARSSFAKSRAEEIFTQALKADKKFVANKEKATQVKLDKMSKLKALRLAKEASDCA
jgi:hypothetical protein